MVAIRYCQMSNKNSAEKPCQNHVDKKKCNCPKNVVGTKYLSPKVLDKQFFLYKKNWSKIFCWTKFSWNICCVQRIYNSQNGIISPEQNLSGQIAPGTMSPGKSPKHASNACGQFLRKWWPFLNDQQFSCSFYPSMPTKINFFHVCKDRTNVTFANFIGLWVFQRY